MHIQAAVARQIEHALRKNQSVGNHNKNIEIEGFYSCDGFLIPERWRLHYGQPAFQRQSFYWAWCRFFAPAGTAVWLREHCHDVEIEL